MIFCKVCKLGKELLHLWKHLANLNQNWHYPSLRYVCLDPTNMAAFFLTVNRTLKVIRSDEKFQFFFVHCLYINQVSDYILLRASGFQLVSFMFKMFWTLWLQKQKECNTLWHYFNFLLYIKFLFSCVNYWLFFMLVL